MPSIAAGASSEPERAAAGVNSAALGFSGDGGDDGAMPWPCARIVR